MPQNKITHLLTQAKNLAKAQQSELPLYGHEFIKNDTTNPTGIIMCLIALESRASTTNARLKAGRLHYDILTDMYGWSY